MSWIFHRVKLKGYGDDFPEEWILKISSCTQLLTYWMGTQPFIVQEAFKNQRDVIDRKAHYTNETAFMANLRAECRGTSFVDELSVLSSERLEGMMNILRDGKILFIKSVGSYSFDTLDQKLYEILETRELEKLVFPTAKSDLRFLQWPGGKHWYAKIGNTEVVVDGKNKWNSRAAARRAANAFIKKVFGI